MLTIIYYLFRLTRRKLIALRSLMNKRTTSSDGHGNGRGVHAGSRARRDGDRAAYCVTHVSHCAGRLTERQRRIGRV